MIRKRRCRSCKAIILHYLCARSWQNELYRLHVIRLMYLMCNYTDDMDKQVTEDVTFLAGHSISPLALLSCR
jgi:hypothetical protein